MIVDTSAVVAVLFEGEDAEIYARAFAQADSCRMSAATFVEAAVVVDSQTRTRAVGSSMPSFAARESRSNP